MSYLTYDKQNSFIPKVGYAERLNCCQKTDRFVSL